MKRITAIFLVCVLLLSFSACSTQNKGNIPVLETEHITIDSICIDNSYLVEEGSSLKLLYIFYTLKATDENLKIDSTYMDLTMDDVNTYRSEHLPKACKSTPSYTYTSYIQDVYVGEEIKMVATFKIPEAELVAGRKMAISDDQLPDEEKLNITTDVIKRFESAEEMAKSVDVDGYAEIIDKQTEADPETAKMVSNLIDGYYFSFYVNSTSYKIEFFSGNRFELRTSLGIGNVGSYSVRKGYIFCTYDSNGSVVEIPYTIENGDIKLNLTTAFDVREN